jgi:2-polyprenyl-3-methyl-5-hydroxy-6-metoxy-1,4-benzoquinol methylase
METMTPPTTPAGPNGELAAAVEQYWDEHIHDLEIARHPVGSAAFFEELDAYRFEKLSYLPALVDFAGFRDLRLLEVGCGVATDLAHLARGGANVTGVDVSRTAIELARSNFAHSGLAGEFHVMNGESLAFEDGSFDVVYAFGVLQYTANPERMVAELHRVLRPEGQAIMMVYNRRSWLAAMSRLTGVALEHADAPAYRLFAADEFRRLLAPFSQVQITYERFPVATRLHQGLTAAMFNGVFVRLFNALPHAWVRPLGWHLVAKAGKR